MTRLLYPSFIALLSLSLCEKLIAQNPSLVKDINAQPAPFVIYNGGLFASDDAIFFNVNDNSGQSFWNTDGTTAGTYLVMPTLLVEPRNFNGLTYFAGDNGLQVLSGTEVAPYTGGELYSTDGTGAGTKLIKDINPGISSSSPSKLTVCNNRLFFFASQTGSGAELWSSDGTESGTQLVKDIWPGKKSSIDNKNNFLIALGNKVIFTANNSTTGNELFISDGTASGTSLVKELTPDSLGSYFYSPVTFNSAVYFFGGSTKNDLKLWKTDGTSAGTFILKDFNAASSTEKLMHMTVVNNKLIIAAQSSGIGIELWVSDGTAAGTVLLKDINPGSANSIDVNDARIFTVFNGKAYFEATDGVNGFQPWLTDGTVGGTKMIATINQNNGAFSGFEFTQLSGNNFIIFDFHQNLYKSDGTAVGTISLNSALPNNPSIEEAISFNGGVIFITEEYVPSFTRNIWKTDGTIAGTQQVIINVNETASSWPEQMVPVSGGKFVFSAYDGLTGIEPWVTDGTQQGTTLLKEMIPGPSGAELEFSPETVNGKAFFTVDFSGHDELWITDGTAAGTQFLNNDIVISYINTKSAQGNGILYYVVNNTATNTQLWRSDGTPSGTYSITPASLTHWFESLTFYNGKLYFAGESKSTGEVELWVSDGTMAGTMQFADLYPGSGSSYPGGLTVSNGKLYFKAYDAPGNASRLFVSDGTVSGTHTLKESTLSAGKTFVTLGGLTYFSGSDTDHGTEIWQTDGTELGTKLFIDVAPGVNSSGAAPLFGSSDHFYFVTFDYKMFATDGTLSGTELLPINGVYPLSNSFRQVNGWDFFANQKQVFQSDGTACHSKEVTPFPGVDNLPVLFSVDDNQLLMSSNSINYGHELFAYAVAPPSTIEICNGFDDDCNGLVDDGAVVATITPAGTFDICDGELIVLNANTGSDLTYQWYYNGNLISGETNPFISSSTLSGSVNVVVTSLFGCSDTSEATTVHRLPSPPAKITTLGSLDICSTGFVKLKANNGNGYIYQWLLINAEIPGATDKTYIATQVGNYKVTVTGNNGCGKTSKKVTVFTSCKGSEPIVAGADELKLYPNPSTDFLHVELPVYNDEVPLEITITDLLGRIVYREKRSPEPSFTLQLPTNMLSGLYLLSVESSEEGWQVMFEVGR